MNCFSIFFMWLTTWFNPNYAMVLFAIAVMRAGGCSIILAFIWNKSLSLQSTIWISVRWLGDSSDYESICSTIAFPIRRHSTYHCSSPPTILTNFLGWFWNELEVFSQFKLLTVATIMAVNYNTISRRFSAFTLTNTGIFAVDERLRCPTCRQLLSPSGSNITPIHVHEWRLASITVAENNEGWLGGLVCKTAFSEVELATKTNKVTIYTERHLIPRCVNQFFWILTAPCGTPFQI